MLRVEGFWEGLEFGVLRRLWVQGFREGLGFKVSEKV
jgi:hypothetical protein